MKHSVLLPVSSYRAKTKTQKTSIYWGWCLEHHKNKAVNYIRKVSSEALLRDKGPPRGTQSLHVNCLVRTSLRGDREDVAGFAVLSRTLRAKGRTTEWWMGKMMIRLVIMPQTRIQLPCITVPASVVTEQSRPARADLRHIYGHDIKVSGTDIGKADNPLSKTARDTVTRPAERFSECKNLGRVGWWGKWLPTDTFHGVWSDGGVWVVVGLRFNQPKIIRTGLGTKDLKKERKRDLI